jgi:hypothetical protein
MPVEEDVAPDSTAARVALWRALHVEIDPPPHILEDEIGLRLLAPKDDWRRRGDMDPRFTRPFRASIVARAAETEHIAHRRNSRCRSIAKISGGSSGRCFGGCGKTFRRYVNALPWLKIIEWE